MPFIDGRLADASRVHAVLGSVASPGTCISLRVPAGRSFSVEDCVASGSLPPGAAQLLSRTIEAKLTFLISGGAGSGKTTYGLEHTNSSLMRPAAPRCRPQRRRLRRGDPALWSSEQPLSAELLAVVEQAVQPTRVAEAAAAGRLVDALNGDHAHVRCTLAQLPRLLVSL
jgi:hypothetical protein